MRLSVVFTLILGWNCAFAQSDSAYYKYTYLTFGVETRINSVAYSSTSSYIGIYGGGQFSLIDALVCVRKKKLHVKDYIGGDLNIGYAHSYLPNIDTGIWASYKYYVGFAWFYNFSQCSHIGFALFPLEFYRDFTRDYSAGSSYKFWYKTNLNVFEAGISSYSRMYFAVLNFLDTNSLNSRILASYSRILANGNRVGFATEYMPTPWENDYENSDKIFHLKLFFNRNF